MINQAFLRTLRDDINAALVTVGEKHGIILHAGNASFTDASCTFKLEGRALTESGKPTLAEMEKHLLVHEINHPLVTKENIEGFTFRDNRTGRTLTITGYNHKAPKFCVQLIDDKGRAAKAPAGYVRQNLPFTRQTI